MNAQNSASAEDPFVISRVTYELYISLVTLISLALATLGVMAWFEQGGAPVELVRTLGFVTFSLTHLYAVYS